MRMHRGKAKGTNRRPIYELNRLGLINIVVHNIDVEGACRKHYADSTQKDIRMSARVFLSAPF